MVTRPMPDNESVPERARELLMEVLVGGGLVSDANAGQWRDMTTTELAEVASLLSASTKGHRTNVCPRTCPSWLQVDYALAYGAGAQSFACECACLSRTRMAACSDRPLLPYEASMSE